MRYWEIDMVRGLAVIAMVFFNWSFALYYLGVFTVAGGAFFWQILPRLIGGTFIFIAGLSLRISYSRNPSMKKHLSRGLKIFLIGIGITVVTWLTFPADTIVFGILHLIGLSIVIGYFLAGLDAKLLGAMAVLLIATGAYLQTVTFGFSFLVWLGFAYNGFRTLDYFPLLPWLGIFIAGITFGKVVYARRKAGRVKNKAFSAISFIGRHSLEIYLLHQPLLIAALFALGLL